MTLKELALAKWTFAKFDQVHCDVHDSERLSLALIRCGFFQYQVVANLGTRKGFMPSPQTTTESFTESSYAWLKEDLRAADIVKNNNSRGVRKCITAESSSKRGPAKGPAKASTKASTSTKASAKASTKAKASDYSEELEQLQSESRQRVWMEKNRWTRVERTRWSQALQREGYALPLPLH